MSVMDGKLPSKVREFGYISSVAVKARMEYPELIYWLIEASSVAKNRRADVIVMLGGEEYRIRATYHRGKVTLSNPNN